MTDLQRDIPYNYMLQSKNAYNTGDLFELKITVTSEQIKLNIYHDAGKTVLSGGDMEIDPNSLVESNQNLAEEAISAELKILGTEDDYVGPTTKGNLHLGKLPETEFPSYRGPRNAITGVIYKFKISEHVLNPIEDSLVINKIDRNINAPISSVSFDENSGYVKIPGFELNVGDQFSIDFINNNVNGPIFYAYTIDQNGQWNSLLIRIVYRRVQVISTVANVHRHDNAYKAYRLGSITQIVITRISNQILKITVNKRQNLEIISREWHNENAPYKYEHVFIGGIQPDAVVSQTEKIQRPQIRIKNFDGCVLKMNIKGSQIDFNNALEVNGSANFKECKAKINSRYSSHNFHNKKYKSTGLDLDYDPKGLGQTARNLVAPFGSSSSSNSNLSKGKSSSENTCSSTYTYNLEQTAVQFGWKPDSYIIKKLTPSHQKSLTKKFRLKLDVKTYAKHGVLIYATKVNKGDYDIRLSLSSGHVLLNIVAPGAKKHLKIMSKKAINDGYWHTIYLHQQRKTRNIFMKIDNMRKAGIDDHQNVLMKDFQFPQEVYFGGRPHATAYTSEKYKSPDACMKNIYIGRVPLDISDPNNCNFITGCGRKHEPGMFFPGNSGNHSKITDSYAEISDIFGPNNEFKSSFSFRSFTPDSTIFETEIMQNPPIPEDIFAENSDEDLLPYIKMTVQAGRVNLQVDDIDYTTNQGNLVCDGDWHDINMYISKQTVRIILDGSYILRPKNLNGKINKSANFQPALVFGSTITKLNYYEGNDVAKPSLLLGAYYDADTGEIISDYRGCMKKFKITSNRNWRWKNVYMVTNQSCPVPGA